MASSTVAQHATQPLNFGPEWLRALSTPDPATPAPSSSGSGNIFKFSATKYRYSKDEILALRVNVSERLSETVKNEIMENLKDVESVFRPNIMDPLSLTPPTSEETAKMNALSSYISGRTPGGAGRAGHNSQQSQQDTRSNRGGGGGSVSNGRGGSRGRGGRDHNYGPNRASSNNNNNNNNSDDNGENENTGDEPSASSTSSSWSRGNYQSRGGSFTNRVRSFDDREQSQTFRRGGGISTRQTSEVWRRSRGDDDENNQQYEDTSTTVNGSSSWTARGGQTKRGGGSGSMEQRTKSNEKWNSNDDRPSQLNSYESNQQRSGWRTNSSTSDRDFNSRRQQPKRDRMPEWMDDNNDDNQLSNATFEQDGTFTRSSSIQQNNSNEQFKAQSQSASDESLSQHNSDSSRQKEEIQPEKPTSKVDTTVVNASVAPEPIISQPTPPVQHFLPSWDDDYDHSDVAKTVVEATLAEDHDYSPPISANPTPRLISIEPTPSNVPIISQQRTSANIDDKQWYYKDPQSTVQGPFSSADMERWFAAGYFTVNLPVKRLGEAHFSTIQQLTKELGRLPFRTDVSSLPSTPVQKQQQQQSMGPEPQKFHLPSSATTNNAYIEDYLMQQSQLRQNVQHSTMFNRQTSMPVSTNERKPISSSSNMSSQLPAAYFNSQQSSLSSMFSSNLANDPVRIFQQQQLQRSFSSTNQQQSNPLVYDEVQRSLRNLSSQSSSSNNNSSYFPSNISLAQQQSNDLMTRLSQAMQTHGKQQQEKIDEERRIEQQRREIEFERLKLFQQAEQIRLQHEEDERRQFEQQELRKKHEINNNRQMIFDQLAKPMDSKKQSTMDIDPFLTFQQSIPYQKEQQANIEAQQAENIRRYQEKYREQPQPSMYKVPEANNWNRLPSQTTESAQLYNLTELQKQEQDRRSREAAAFAHQYAKSQTLPIPNFAPSSSSSANKTSSWAQTLFAVTNSGNSNVPSTSSHIMSDYDTNENTFTESSSSIAAYNQQATNAVLSLLNIHPKSRSATSQQSTSWNTPNKVSNTLLQDTQRSQQETQNDAIQLQQSHHITSGHSLTSAPTWPSNVQQQQQQPISSQQSPSGLFWANQNSSSSNKPIMTNNNKSSAPWTEIKPTPSLPTITSEKIISTNDDTRKNESETKNIFNTTRTQDALSRWTQAQFKDNFKDVDVPTLVQLLKDIDNAGEIIEYIQPYIGTVSKAKEFTNDFLLKRKQLANAEPDLDNERLIELVMAPTSCNDNSGSGGDDEGFQLASSNGQKKKAKKLKGQKIDGKQREDVDKIMADLDDERLIQNPILRLKAALHAACGKICDQLQIQSNITVDKQVVAAVGDVTFQQIETFCQDLDVFSKHGKRTTINADDVRLLCRRNPGLLDKIDDVQRSLKPSKPTSRSSNSRSNISSRYDDHNVDITVVESSSDMDDIN
ncbi:unnamed protein product [Rotaria socialis]|uniref:Centromere protein S n=1 Tax=Rotaria socialis TaxID=392032 RepID=A0A820F3I4_9BILA|nr:unnamed protein product [Rotaria socialis]